MRIIINIISYNKLRSILLNWRIIFNIFIYHKFGWGFGSLFFFVYNIIKEFLRVNFRYINWLFKDISIINFFNFHKVCRTNVFDGNLFCVFCFFLSFSFSFFFFTCQTQFLSFFLSFNSSFFSKFFLFF